MGGEVTRRTMERWLLSHGSQDLTKKHVGLIVRQLVAAGFDRATVLRELKG